MLDRKLFHSRISIGFCCLLLLIALTGTLWAQSNTGRLVGTIYDSAGAVVPGAKLVITDDQNKKERSFTSDEAGSVIVPLLDVGKYTVKVTKDGFKSFTAKDVTIQIGREYPLQVVLEVGGIDTTVEVSAGTSLVNTTSGEISTTINPKQIIELPLNGRNPLNLILLQAGTSSNSAQYTSINGQRTGMTNITRDGINIQDAFIRSNATDFAPGRPTVDDTEEFTMSSQNAGADSGYGGAQIRLVTPRGTGSYHGSAWEFNRNSDFAANDFFNNRSGSDRPFRNRNQFGGKIGGPVPGLKNKVYFFGFYEGTRDVVTSIYTRTLLLPNARNGIFTYVDNAKNTKTINLLSLVPSVSTIDPTIKTRMLDPMPTAGNRPDIGDQINTTGLQLNQPANTTRDSYTLRGDYDLSVRHNFNVVYTWNKENNLRPDVNSTESFLVNHPVDQQSTNTMITGSHRWAPGVTFFNEARFGIFKSDVPFNRKNTLPDYFIVPGVFSNTELTFMDQGRKVKNYTMSDNAEKILGRHSLRFGGSVSMYQVDPYNAASIVPTWTAGTNPNTPVLAASMFPGGISTTQLSTANSLFSTLGGIISSGVAGFNVESKESGYKPVPRREDYRYSNYSFFVNDQYRITPRLTLNFGLRYEIITPPRLLNGLGLEPVINGNPIQAVLNPGGTYNYIGTNAGNNKLFKTDWNNIAPVVSFAYSPKWENSILKAIFGTDGAIRGGYRESYVNDQNLTAARNAMNNNVGMGLASVSAINPATGTSQLNARLSSLPTIAPPAVIVPRTYVQNNTAAFTNFGTVFGTDPNLKISRIQEYNFGIQRPIKGGLVWEVRYVGGRSNNLWRVNDYNQIDIRDNGFAEDFNRARRNLIANGNASKGETLTVFPNLASGGLLTNSTVKNNLISGIPADLSLIYIQNQLTGTVKFLPNGNTGVADLLINGASYRYNAFQTELNKRFARGFYFGINYTWQKTLTNAIGTSQTLLDTTLDLRQPSLEWTRADYDTAHIFNFNSVYELPFGRGKRFGNGSSALMNHIIGGWQVAGIWRWTSGTPITIVDPRGTLNRAGRSARQTPNIRGNYDSLKSLLGTTENSKGIYYINPKVVNPATGRGAEGWDTTPFAGQIFYNVAPGQTGYMGRAVFDGPNYFNIDASLSKSFRIKESVNLQLRFEAFNFLNNVNFYLGQIQSINSTSFGRMTGDWGPRVLQFGGRLNF